MAPPRRQPGRAWTVRRSPPGRRALRSCDPDATGWRRTTRSRKQRAERPRVGARVPRRRSRWTSDGSRRRPPSSRPSRSGRRRARASARSRVALAATTDRERHAAAELEALLAADAGDRARLGEAERSASGARERLRAAEDRLRSIEVADLEARLGLESLREQTPSSSRASASWASAISWPRRAARSSSRDRRPQRPTTRTRRRRPCPPGTRPRRGDPAVGRDVVHRRAADAGSPRHAPPPIPRAGRGQPLRRRGVRSAAGAPDDPRGPGRRPEGRDRQDPRRSSPSSTSSSRHGSGRRSPSWSRRSIPGSSSSSAVASRGSRSPTRATSRRPASRSSRGHRARSRRRWRCSPAASVPSPRSPCCSRCSRCAPCPSASSTRSTPRSTRRTSAGSRMRCASSRSGRSSSSSPTTAARSRRPTRCTA